MSADFSEEFIQAAPIAEPSAEERSRIAERKQRVHRLSARLAAENTAANAERRRLRRRTFTRRLIWSSLALGLIAAVIVVSKSADNAGAGHVSVGPDGSANIVSTDPSRPTPQVSASDQPLGRPARLPNSSGPYSFLAHQPGSAAPVTYDPCRPIHYAVNSANAPPKAKALVTDAIERVHQATGLVFLYNGPTAEAPSQHRTPFQPSVYGDKWAPVVIWWTNPTEFPTLAGNVAGEGGSTAEVISGPEPQTEVYVSGIVALDGPQLQQILSEQNGYAMAQAIILHELGHLVGLGHVQDPTQIMNPVLARATTDYGAGDLHGLADLGAGTCVPNL